MRRCAETQFDPQVVASLIAVLEVDSDLSGLLQALEEPMVTSEPFPESGAAPFSGHPDWRPAAAG